MIQPAAMQARCMLLIAADARLYGKHAWFRDVQTQLKNVAVLTSTVTVMIASARTWQHNNSSSQQQTRLYNSPLVHYTPSIPHNKFRYQIIRVRKALAPY